MDTNRIKRFATEARNKLKEGIAAKIRTLGFDKKGNVAEEHRPQLMQGGTHWNGQLLPETFYHQWTSLYLRIQLKGISEVYEEAAYTWFNRLCAIRILQKNDLCAPVLDYTDAARTPFIVDEARQGRIPEMNDDMRSRLSDLLDDDTKVTEQFAVLINAWCHDNPIINSCFGAMADYTELLLPNNILTEGGFVDMLNHTDFITDADYRSPELIGWLYQVYISERKDEVFAKKGKFEADEIPAATQIFTPNWIVKYMVQNTVGRIYLDNNPYETQLQKKWQYLVEPSEKPSANSVLKYDELTDLRVADLACGSGHILNECFDLLYDLYIAEGYGRGEAIENIFRHNLTGVDLDTRAKQLATFALLLKACQKDNAFADAHCLPRVLDMTGIVPDMNEQELSDACLHFMGGYEGVAGEMLEQDFELLRDADNLGSIMKFNDDEDYLAMLRYHYDDWTEGGIEDCPEEIKALVPGVRLILALTEKYHALIANPPYMGRGHMTKELSSYLDKNYPTTKADLFSAFMEMMLDRTLDNGKTAFITMESWMFLSSFEKFRKYILDNYFISSMGHFGWHIIGIAFGTAMTVIDKCKSNGRKGEYSYLTIDDVDRTKNVPFVFPKKDNGRYAIVNQQDFEKIPGCPIGYWVSENWLRIFSHKTLTEDVISDGQTKTGDNNKYLRLIWEVSKNSRGTGSKWVKHPKGGGFRKWFGNLDTVIDWSIEAREHYRKDKVARILPEYLWWKQGISWNLICSKKQSFRLYNDDEIFNLAAPTLFFKNSDNILYSLGLFNTPISEYIIKLVNPTLNSNIGDILSIPYIIDDKKGRVIKLVQQNISISKQDWDAHETSWDFQCNEIVALDSDEKYIDTINSIYEGTGIVPDLAAPQLGSLEWRTNIIKEKWEDKFRRLHGNEEELNRLFIDIYGLQDELTPNVPISEITILQQGEISIKPEGSYCGSLVWHDDVLMKQFISYAVGCMMGRYRLDKPGLHIAHSNPSDEEVCTYTYNGRQFAIDDDAIIPLMSRESAFNDNAGDRFKEFLKVTLGEDTLTENLNFIEAALGKDIETYFVKDFWKDHLVRYQRRPIYWLFTSKKGAFQCLVYMHRMNPYTAEQIRNKYLLPHIEYLGNRIAEMEQRAASLTTKERKMLDKLQKDLEECREYHDRLHLVADRQIDFDLDDGVVVNYAKFDDVLAMLK